MSHLQNYLFSNKEKYHGSYCLGNIFFPFVPFTTEIKVSVFIITIKSQLHKPQRTQQQTVKWPHGQKKKTVGEKTG